METGVSATHLDWTMVPYVRKSFYKHYKDAREFIEDDVKVDETEYSDSLSIDSDIYKASEKWYNYAMKMTKKELKQAVEGMYHNLN